MSSRQQLQRVLHRIAALRSGLEAARSDVSLVARKAPIVIVVDTSWLFRYLLPGRSVMGQSFAGNAVDKYLVALSFQRSWSPFVFLPGYFNEFRSVLHLWAREVAPSALSDSAQRQMSSQLRTRLETMVRDHRKELDAVASSDGAAQDLLVAGLCKALRELVSDAHRILQRASDVVVCLQRFSQLHEAGRLRPLSAVAELSQAELFPNEAVVESALNALEAQRSEPEFDVPNRTDAYALGAIASMARALSEKRGEVLLATGAHSLAAAAEEINVDREVITKPLAVRTPYYWMWWFGAVARRDGWSKEPSLEVIESVYRSFAPALAELAGRGLCSRSRYRTGRTTRSWAMRFRSATFRGSPSSWIDS